MIHECPNCRALCVDVAEDSAHCHSCGISYTPSRELRAERGDEIPHRFYADCASVKLLDAGRVAR